MPDDVQFYLFAIPAVLPIGLAKGGFTGLGALGQFTLNNAVASAALLPAAVMASLFGVRLSRRVSVGRAYIIVFALMIVAGVKLLLDGLGAR